MKKYILFFLIAVTLQTFSQTKKTYFDSEWDVTTKDKASFYRPAPEYKDGLYHVEDYYITGELQFKGTKKNVEVTDEIWEGIATWYYKDGSINDKLLYENGEIIGDYYPYEYSKKRTKEGYEEDELYYKSRKEIEETVIETTEVYEEDEVVDAVKDAAEAVVEGAGYSEEDRIIREALWHLGLSKRDCYQSLISVKKLPYNENRSIVVIPEVLTRDDYSFTLNSNILVVDTNTHEVLLSYYESGSTNGWVSDAIQLRDINIITAPFRVTDGKTAFGIELYFYGSSNPNPYSSKNLTLFIPQNKRLVKIADIETSNYSGEWDTDCKGEFTLESKAIEVQKTKTNNFYDLKVTTTINNTTREKVKNDCVDSEKKSEKTELLKFNGKKYKKS